jgi:5-methylthioadenosine/S-adenosylhomocysteine deaminase
MARSQKIPLHMHLSQTAGERERTRQKEGVSPVVFAKECGALTEKTLAVHLVSADDSDLKILKDHGTTVGLCPASQIIYENLAPIAAFSRYRLPIALGTDCAASNDSSNILSELKLTALLCRHEKVQPEHLEPSNLLKMVTLNPARAFGLDHLIGSLAPGKMADLGMLKMSVDTQPMTNPITNLIFSMGAQHVEHVMINGQWSLWQGNLVRVSEQEIIKRSRDAWDEIKKRAGL